MTTIDMDRQEGAAVPLSCGPETPSNTIWPGPTAEVYFRTKWRLRPSSRLATIDMGHKFGAGGCALFSGVAGSPSNTVAWAEAYFHTKWHLSPSSRLATTDIGQKRRCAPFGGGELGPHLAQCGLDQGLSPCQVPC